MSKYLICGAGGFIGGHLAERLINDGHEVTCVDIKPLEYWFQLNENSKNFSLDLKDFDNCLKVTENIEFIYNMACNIVEWALLKIIKLNVRCQFL